MDRREDAQGLRLSSRRRPGIESTTTAGHYALCRALRLEWFRNHHGEWHWHGTDSRSWEVICTQCGDTDGPPAEESDEVQLLRGPYSLERAREMAAYHSSGMAPPEQIGPRSSTTTGPFRADGG